MEEKGIIKELNRVVEITKDKQCSTFEINITLMAKDCLKAINSLQTQLDKELESRKKTVEYITTRKQILLTNITYKKDGYLNAKLIGAIKELEYLLSLLEEVK